MEGSKTRFLGRFRPVVRFHPEENDGRISGEAWGEEGGRLGCNVCRNEDDRCDGIHRRYVRAVE